MTISVAKPKKNSPNLNLNFIPIILLCHRFIWQGNIESRPLAFATVSPNFTMVSFHNFFSNGQAQAGTTLGPGTCLINPVKAVKDVTQIFSCNTQALVSNTKSNMIWVLGYSHRNYTTIRLILT